MPLDSLPFAQRAEVARSFGLRPNGLVDLDAIQMTPAQLIERRRTLNCSELPILYAADPLEVNELAAVKWGQLDDGRDRSLNADAGHHMESFILAVAERELGVVCTRMRERMQPRRRPWMSVTLDAFTEYYGQPWVVQTKFMHPRYPIRDALQHYAPQVLGEAYCTGAAGCLVVIYNQGSALECFEIPAEPIATAELLSKCDQFWDAVQARRLPFLMPCVEKLPEAAPAIRVGQVNKSRDPEWRVWEELWLETREAAAEHKRATEMLKALVPADKQHALGNAVEVKVARNGAKTVGLIKSPKHTGPAAEAA